MPRFGQVFGAEGRGGRAEGDTAMLPARPDEAGHVDTTAWGLVAGDRRVAQRYPARFGGATITWFREGEREEVRGSLADISLGGALLIMDRLPPAGAPVWMRLDAVSSQDWVEVSALDARRDVGGGHQVRVAFPAGCPYMVFRTVVWGRLRNDFSEATKPGAGSTGGARSGG